jgi:hypothetical protein
MRSRLLFLILLFAALLPAQVVAPPEEKKPAREEKPRISDREAQQLFHSADEILKWVSNETRLPIKHKVKYELSSRGQVEHVLTDRMKDDEDAKRLKRSELVLKKFGLLPREFDLSTFMVSLLREQILGFYDPPKQTVFLLNWIEPEQQKPVLAHELTHALQDQAIHLEKWMHGRESSKPDSADAASGNSFAPKSSDNKRDKDEEKEQREVERLIASDEIQTARQAVTEGQGMAVLVNYELEPLGRSITNSPEMIQAMRANTGESSDSPVFEKAPKFIKEALTFPYRYGPAFVQAVWIRSGRDAAFRGALEEPPSTSREIMQPETYIKREHLPPMHVPHIINLLGPGWERYDVGAMGEFDVYLLLEQYAGERTASRFAPKWRGGYYYAAHKQGSTAPAGVAETAAVDVFYVSRWASAQDAQDFAAEYAKGLAKRYSSVTPVADGNSGRTTRWRTEEGEVVIEPAGELVLVTESFDAELGAKLRAAAVAAEAGASSGPR